MKKLEYIFTLGVFAFISCNTNDNNKGETQNKETHILKKVECPCDSIGTFKIRGKNVSYCYFGKSQIAIANFPGSDTIEVRRYYTTDPVWHLQEVIEIINDKIIEPEYAMYCDIKDTIGFYKLTYIRNEDMYINQGVITNSVLGVEVAIGKDTIKSKKLSILVPKEKFIGIIKVEKIIDISYKGKRRGGRPFIFIEAESMIKYGNLLEQYKAIKKNCELSH